MPCCRVLGKAVSCERGTPVHVQWSGFALLGLADTRGLYQGVARSSPSLLLSSLELRDANVYELKMRARLGSTTHFFEVVALELRTVPANPLGQIEGDSSCLTWILVKSKQPEIMRIATRGKVALPEISILPSDSDRKMLLVVNGTA